MDGNFKMVLGFESIEISDKTHHSNCNFITIGVLLYKIAEMLVVVVG